MNSPEDDLARRIVGHLDAGGGDLDPAVRERLVTARTHALARYRERPAPVFGLAWAGHAIARVTGRRLYSARNVVGAALLLIGLSGVAIWSALRPTNELADIDAGLLSDELPINAYLDKGFDSWLERASR